MANNPGDIVMMVFVALSVVWILFPIVKALKNRYAPVRAVKATVVDKNRIELFSKYSGNGKSYRYAVVFEAEGKKRSFYVSEFSFGGYRKGETGTLKYKGDRLIDFH